MLLTADPSAKEVIQPQRINLPMRLSSLLARNVPVAPRRLRNAGPLLSLTFDDAPLSAVTAGAAMLERHGLRGTFYLATGMLGGTTPHWALARVREVADLAARGHELGLHTHSHRPIATMGRHQFAEELRTCRRLLLDMAPGAALANFAFPFGLNSVMHLGLLHGIVRSSRTTHPGINAGMTDIQALRSWALGDAVHRQGHIDLLLDQTVRNCGWLILTGHDVAEKRSPFGCTPAFLAHIIGAALSRGIRIVPVDAALDLCGIQR